MNKTTDTAVQAPLSLELPPPRAITSTSRRGGITAAFERFHAANPHVYQALRTAALHAVARGRKVGMKAIYERVRWEYAVETREEPYKLNNNYTAHYARLLMESVPELHGYFETRNLRSR